MPATKDTMKAKAMARRLKRPRGMIGYCAPYTSYVTKEIKVRIPIIKQERT